MKPGVVVLDAMGVLYEPADDVAELLIPYLRRRGSEASDREIEDLYVQCSLGELSSDEFWTSTGVSGRASDQEYCLSHTLTPGVAGFLAAVEAAKIPVACLSNDVSSWSARLRRRFGLQRSIDRWLISGDLGMRKPDPRVYQELLRRCGYAPKHTWFVDDRLRNVLAARQLGITALHYGSDVRSMSELAGLVTGWS